VKFYSYDSVILHIKDKVMQAIKRTEGIAFGEKGIHVSFFEGKL